MEAHKRQVRVRIAPSPTGPMHIGTVRAALFNWLFARKHQGSFLLRIEDTDKERSEKKYEEGIIKGFEWLNLIPDEEILRQSERTEVYKKYIQQLLDEGKAYYCYCSKEELEADRQAMMSQGLTPKYSGRCRKNPPEGQEPQLIRLKGSEKRIAFKDIIRGQVEFDANLIGDIAIAKDLETPLYNLAVVVDDAEMEISHVIRGEDHIPNTPRQILIAEALGFSRPQYAHLPLILSPDGGKMSKREGKQSLAEFKEEGYLPEALINFLAFLGWHPEDDKEIMSRKELVEQFSLERVQKGGAVFNQDKLDWLNAQYIKKMSDEELFAAIVDFVPEEWLETGDRLKKIIAVQRERMKQLTDIRELGDFFFKLPDYEGGLLLWKEMTREEARESLRESLKIVSGDPEFFEEKIVALSQEMGRGNVFWPLRVALSGQKNSPPPLELIKVLGTKESVKRIETAIEKLK